MSMDRNNRQDDWAGQIDAFLDGELTGQRAEALERLRRDDPVVAEALRRAEALESKLATLSQANLEIDWDRQREEIVAQAAARREADRPRRMVRLVLRPAAAAAAMAAMVLVAVNVRQPPAPGGGSSGIAQASLIPAFPVSAAQPVANVEAPRMGVSVAFENALRDLSAGSVVVSVGMVERLSSEQPADANGADDAFLMY